MESGEVGGGASVGASRIWGRGLMSFPCLFFLSLSCPAIDFESPGSL